MADTVSKTQNGAIIQTTATHNVSDDVTFLLKNVTGQSVNLQTGQGTATVATAGTAVTVNVTFPTAYQKIPQNVRVLVAGSSGGNAGYLNAYTDPTSWTTTGFTVTVNAYVAGTIKFSWISIGS